MSLAVYKQKVAAINHMPKDVAALHKLVEGGFAPFPTVPAERVKLGLSGQKITPQDATKAGHILENLECARQLPRLKHPPGRLTFCWPGSMQRANRER